MAARHNKETGAPAEAEPPSFEENLKRLEQIVAELEQGNLPLDKSLKLYEEGIRAYRSCCELLQQAEARVTKLVQTLEGGLKEEPLESPEGQ